MSENNNKEKKRVHYMEVTEQVDKETGEVTNIKKRASFQVPREPDYVKLYVRDLIRLKDLPPSSGKVLMALLRSMGYNNIIPVYAPIKKMMCQDLGIKMNTLNKAIDNLYKKDILIRLDRGIYIADPELFGRGAWENVRDIRMMITYNKDGKKEIETSFKNQLKLF